MNKKKSNIITAVVVLISFVTSQVEIKTCMAISDYNRPTVNPAIVPDPLVYNYTLCVDKYLFCSCELIGQGVDIATYDKNGDGKLSFIEMRAARFDNIFTDAQMGNETFLACHYEPPSPGPYSSVECKKLFGENDCVCMANHGNYYGQCYSRSIIKFSPEPISIPEVFCSHISPTGFDNCLCDDAQQDAYLGGDIKCYVLPEKMEQTWECNTDNIRIFPGSKYTCRTKDGLVFRPNCCPGDVKCAITEYDSGIANMGAYLSAASTLLNAYQAYVGYSTLVSGGTLYSFAAELAGTATGSLTGVADAAEMYSTAGELGGMANSALGALSTTLFYAYVAYMIYNYLATTYNTCKSGEYELICKASANLCIYTGEQEVSSTKEVKVYMCYSSQIAKIVNEYGLPQIYDPDCHIDSCDAGNNSSSCGCKRAYTIGGKPTKTRHKGFSVDEFERLDFSQIPISEGLKQAMLANPAAEVGRDFAEIPALMTPSPFLLSEANGSIADQAPDPGNGDTGKTKNEGNCTYKVDGSIKWPIEKADFQMVDHSVGVPTATLNRICVAAPIPVPGRVFVANMGQDMELADRLMLADPSTANNKPHIRICNDAYVNQGWGGDIGAFTIGTILTSGTYFSGLNCLDPIHIGTHFYDRADCYARARFYEVFTFIKNTINDPEQTVTLPDQYWYWDTYDKEGVPTPATHFQDYWAYWLPETDIKRGEWVAVEDKCILKDTDSAKRTLCKDKHKMCFDGCGNNDACKQGCADVQALCIDGPLKYLSPPSIPKSLYVDTTGKPEYASPATDSLKYVYIDATGHVDFNRPVPPTYAVVNVSAHAELTPPPTPREVSVDIRTVGGIVIPAGYNPVTGESLSEPGKYFKDNLSCQSWFIRNFRDKNIDAYLTSTCEVVATGKLRTDPDYNIAKVSNSSICPRDYTLGASCWNDGPVLYNGAGQNMATGGFYKNDPICKAWYQNFVAERKLDYNLANNCTIAPNNSPGPFLVHTFSRTCPSGFAEGLDCTFAAGRAIYNASGIGVFEGATMDNDPACIDWYNNLITTYGIKASLETGCFLKASPKPPGINTFNTTKKQCPDVPGFSLGVDCFNDGMPIYDSNGLDAAKQAFFKDEVICKNWFQAQVTDKGILATLSNRCTLKPMGENGTGQIFSKFDIQGNACPAGFAEGIDCYLRGGQLYDPTTGYSDRFGRFFKDDPVCMKWYQDEIVARGIEANLQNNCTLTAKRDIGKDFYPIGLDTCPQGTIEGTNCFCDCPALVDDMAKDQMICPRPNKKNLLQRLSVHNSLSSAFNTYYGRPDVQTRYELFLP